MEGAANQQPGVQGKVVSADDRQSRVQGGWCWSFRFCSALSLLSRFSRSTWLLSHLPLSPSLSPSLPPSLSLSLSLSLSPSLPLSLPPPPPQGEWAPRRIANPGYWDAETHPTGLAAPMAKIGGVVIEVWTMQGNMLFDNVWVGESIADVKAWTESTFKVKSAAEAANAKEVLSLERRKAREAILAEGGVVNQARYGIALFTDWVEENPVGGVGAVIGAIAFFFGLFYMTMMGGKKKNKRRSGDAKKNDDAASNGNGVHEDDDDEQEDEDDDDDDDDEEEEEEEEKKKNSQPRKRRTRRAD